MRSFWVAKKRWPQINKICKCSSNSLLIWRNLTSIDAQKILPSLQNGQCLSQMQVASAVSSCSSKWRLKSGFRQLSAAEDPDTADQTSDRRPAFAVLRLRRLAMGPASSWSLGVSCLAWKSTGDNPVSASGWWEFWRSKPCRKLAKVISAASPSAKNHRSSVDYALLCRKSSQ